MALKANKKSIDKEETKAVNTEQNDIMEEATENMQQEKSEKQEDDKGMNIELDTASPLEQIKDSESAPSRVQVNTSKMETRRKPAENVKIRLRVNHSCNIAGEQYDFKAGKVYTVPKNVKRIMNKAGFLSPL